MTELKAAESLRDALISRFSEAKAVSVDMGDEVAIAKKLAVIQDIAPAFKEEFLPKQAKLHARAIKPPEQRTINEATVQRIMVLQEWYPTLDTEIASSVAELQVALGNVKFMKAKALQEAEFQLERRHFEEMELQTREAIIEEEEEPAKKIFKAAKEKKKKILSLQKHHASKQSEQKRVQVQKKKDEAFLRPFTEGLSKEEVDADERLEFEIEEEDDREALAHDEVVAWRELVNECHLSLEDLAANAASHTGSTVRFVARTELCSLGSQRSQLKNMAALTWSWTATEGMAKAHGKGTLRSSMDRTRPAGAQVWVLQGFIPVLELLMASKSYADGELLQLQPKENAKIAVVLAHGGYFAGGVWDTTVKNFVVHKTIARYVTRRGQGGRQSAHNGRTDTAGSQIRAFQEKKWMEEMKATLEGWDAAGHFAACDLIFYHAPGNLNYKSIVANSPLGLDKYAAKLHNVPVSTGRPLLSECKEVVHVLLSVSIGVDAAVEED